MTPRRIRIAQAHGPVNSNEAVFDDVVAPASDLTFDTLFPHFRSLSNHFEPSRDDLEPGRASGER